MENATVLKISNEELSAVSKILYNTEYDYKNIATEISKTFQNIKFIIITLGEKGSYAYDVLNKTSFSCANILCPSSLGCKPSGIYFSAITGTSGCRPLHLYKSSTGIE